MVVFVYSFNHINPTPHVDLEINIPFSYYRTPVGKYSLCRILKEQYNSRGILCSQHTFTRIQFVLVENVPYSKDEWIPSCIRNEYFNTIYLPVPLPQKQLWFTRRMATIKIPKFFICCIYVVFPVTVE